MFSSHIGSVGANARGRCASRVSHTRTIRGLARTCTSVLALSGTRFKQNPVIPFLPLPFRGAFRGTSNYFAASVQQEGCTVGREAKHSQQQRHDRNKGLQRRGTDNTGDNPACPDPGPPSPSPANRTSLRGVTGFWVKNGENTTGKASTGCVPRATRQVGVFHATLSPAPNAAHARSKASAAAISAAPKKKRERDHAVNGDGCRSRWRRFRRRRARRCRGSARPVCSPSDFASHCRASASCGCLVRSAASL